ncbi:hypothetical protein BD779DRAFT_1476906 [Infundibulicybe gibba]|nr:hypothetical protein BD779DRAFT_1476906 [Infundibulicybe gibba]
MDAEVWWNGLSRCEIALEGAAESFIGEATRASMLRDQPGAYAIVGSGAGGKGREHKGTMQIILFHKLLGAPWHHHEWSIRASAPVNVSTLDHQSRLLTSSQISTNPPTREEEPTSSPVQLMVQAIGSAPDVCCTQSGVKNPSTNEWHDVASGLGDQRTRAAPTKVHQIGLLPSRIGTRVAWKRLSSEIRLARLCSAKYQNDKEINVRRSIYLA